MGVDRAIVYTLLGRGWASISGLITLWFLARFLTPVEQGFYFTFASVLALQIVFELGMSYVIMQYASHEMVRLTWTATGALEGNEKAKSRLRSLFFLVAKWYGVIALLIVLAILPAGWIFFTINQHAETVAWQPAWIWLIVTAALNIFVIPIFSILEGCGKVAEVARMRLSQNVYGSLLAWLVFIMGGKLFAMPAMNTAMLLVALLWLWFGFGNFFKDLFTCTLPFNEISWKSEIWPFQWKIALSWLGGYFMFQLFVPVLFAYRGAVEAGQMGMSLSIMAALSSIGMAWVSTKAPVFGNLVALKRFTDLDALFSRILFQSVAVVGVVGSILLAGKWFLSYAENTFNERMVPMIPFTLLIIITVINIIVSAEALYLRAHKEEPFMWISVFAGLLISASTFIFARDFGTTGIVIGYFVVSAFVSLGGGSWIFYSKKRSWHGIQPKNL